MNYRVITLFAVLPQVLCLHFMFGCPAPLARAYGGENPALVTIDADAAAPIRRMAGGIGASWHAIETPIPVVGDRSHGGSAWGGHPPAEDRAAWRQIYRHADWLGLDFIRVEVEQRMFEPDRGRFTWDSPEMRILYRILDWCERRQADVFLQNMWGNVAWNAFPEFRDDPVKRVHSGPASMEAFAESMAAMLRHLTVTKGYTCIRWFSINNEPGHDWSWWQAPPNRSMSLRDGLAAVRHALDQAGIRVPLSGPDWTDLPELKPEPIDFDAFIGAYDLHSYYARFDWHAASGYPLSLAEQRLVDWRRWSAARGKPLFLTEVGAMVYGWGGRNPGPSTWNASIKDAELVVRAMNLGVDGFNRWSFVNRGDLDGVWQMIDTWDPDGRTLLRRFVPRPNAYFVYGLISRFTAKHSTIMNVRTTGAQIDGTNRVFSAMSKSPRGELTWLVVNDADRSWPARLTARSAGRSPLYLYRAEPAQQDRPDLRVEARRRITPDSGRFEFTDVLPASSLTVYSTYRRRHSQPGVTSE